MAERTEAERQILYQHDVDIVNRQADGKIAKLKEDFAKVEARHLASVEKERAKWGAWLVKKKVQIKADWDRALAKVRPGNERQIAIINERYDGLEDIAELDMEQRINSVIETDMRALDDVENAMKRKVDDVENWRSRELADEVRQLQTHRQRQRRE